MAILTSDITDVLMKSDLKTDNEEIGALRHESWPVGVPGNEIKVAKSETFGYPHGRFRRLPGPVPDYDIPLTPDLKE
jgi:hypothetical protein